VKSAQELCWRHGIPALDFGDIAEKAFMHGPKKTRKLAGFARYLKWLTILFCTKANNEIFLPRGLIQTLIVVVALGACCVYIVFVSSNIAEVCSAQIMIYYKIY
jgi:solute carrier family 36 (proton-coupled amino acid transporter)